MDNKLRFNEYKLNFVTIAGFAFVFAFFSLTGAMIIWSLFDGHFAVTFFSTFAFLVLRTVLTHEILEIDAEGFAVRTILGERFRCKWSEIHEAKWIKERLRRKLIRHHYARVETTVLAIYTQDRFLHPVYIPGPFLNKKNDNHVWVFDSERDYVKEMIKYLEINRPDLQIERDESVI